ncbi:hypothetical protein BD626DRAFT_573943 [Schizophyllum amplum]|uniref:Uncharacterized protein n=1 Tax=Schizophyllum amplum TaxID=97359 RepID=A0A550C002_9AGAR|nr:hypothetical protein BD626DRAFT_573943 [Auriculariopsis ampla]
MGRTRQTARKSTGGKPPRKGPPRPRPIVIPSRGTPEPTDEERLAALRTKADLRNGVRMRDCVIAKLRRKVRQRDEALDALQDDYDVLQDDDDEKEDTILELEEDMLGMAAELEHLRETEAALTSSQTALDKRIADLLTEVAILSRACDCKRSRATSFSSEDDAL